MLKGGVLLMLEKTWKIFSMTGNIDSYLLFKECERECLISEDGNEEDIESEELDPPLH